MKASIIPCASFFILLAVMSSVCHSAAVTSSTSLDVCKMPANVTLATQSTQALCASAVCVDLGEATLISNGSQICQARGQPQGVFACTRKYDVVDEEANTLYQVGKGTCAMPATSSTYAQYSCKNGAAINVYTMKDGGSSFYVSRQSKDAPGVAGFASWSKGRKRNCVPTDIIGRSDVINDKLTIDCGGFETVCPMADD